MTIAMCHLSTEGVVLGADSTSSAAISPSPGQSGFHYFNYNQKLFELGEDSTLGALTWGLGGLPDKSHRTMFALLSDDLKKTPARSVADAAERWRDQFWSEYSGGTISGFVQTCKTLSGKAVFNPSAASPDPNARTKDEEALFQQLKTGLVAGFCVAGYMLSDRMPAAFEIIFDPLQGKPTLRQIPLQSYVFWGAPNMIRRLMFGWDEPLKDAILKSGKWTGTEADLTTILDQQKLAYMILPIRDAVDFVHACIYSTIKALKFSNLFQICGGPIEIAVIRTDRQFHWVRHKTWDAAITEG
jgi:hypothetical protein